MWLSYIKVALRSLIKQRLYAFINIVGLAIGVTTCILILMFVRYEQGFDRFNENADNIYRLNLEGKLGDNEFRMTNSTAPAGPTMLEEYPEVVNYTRIRNTGFPVLRYGDKVFSEELWFQADSTVFEVFTIPMLIGDPKTALTQPLSVVITERMAKKYFGDEDPLGKVLNSDNVVDFTVTGVVQELPDDSHWHFDFLGSMVTYGDSRNPMWLNNNFQTYLQLAEGASAAEFEAKFPDLIRKYVGPEVQQFLGISFDQLMERGDAYAFFLTPLTDIHLYSNLLGEFEVNGDGQTVTIFAYIAIFILLLACINYMNLSTARSMSRAREIGIRKTLGGNRGQIIVQFLAESIFVTFIAFSLALLLVQMILPWFTELIDTPLVLEISDLPFVLMWVIPVGLLAGSYPAFLLSSFNPLKVLKGNSVSGKGGNWLRNGLVIFQFAVSVTLLISTMVIRDQLDYIQTKDLGLNPDNLLIVKKTDDIGRTIQAFKASLRDDPGTILVSNSTAIPGNEDGLNGNASTMLVNDVEETRLVASFLVDHDYAAAYELTMAEGRFFSRERVTDTNAVILNQAAVKAFGVEDPVGKDLITFFRNTPTPIKIIGVVEDYHFETPQNEIRPMAMFLLGDGTARFRPNWGKFVTLKYDPNRLDGTLAHIESTWKQLAGNQALEYVHFDELYGEMYRTERQSANIVLMFAGLAIFIACLGLLGLASFNAERRTKEIGIRKVLGASVSNVLLLLSKDTLKLMLIAVVVAIPIAYYAMSEWLKNYAYRIDISIMIVVGASLIAMLVAVITVAWQSYRTAVANPVKSLRYE
ncbi:MAG: FtsX-like permease family protein [Candidatus Marinimicrobia bacterium]|jgi:putative ABC transport system permease protein|nr:FtsX-like permease family protein [Candidatus Neomarinimicrobiota bacterium]MBT3630815.1 FtsX-like permease family protein [Candidatus Neomarinimicrobiota bacterium]MBT3823477.1 FtsX-like permease family protein [Candidatus Neomarinimicrobiota bacterium]MBT4130439.1 FtsX-like permease family protein [Candidatus Neomarinimicrobiota bacterium]MBT4294248.1 FtsX-like permease family protein [Candidatus Neomarinimicrobiota bacterium]